MGTARGQPRDGRAELPRRQEYGEAPQRRLLAGSDPNSSLSLSPNPGPNPSPNPNPNPNPSPNPRPKRSPNPDQAYGRQLDEYCRFFVCVSYGVIMCFLFSIKFYDK